MERRTKAVKVDELRAEFERQLALHESAKTRTAARGVLGDRRMNKDVRRMIWLRVVESQRLTFSATMQLLTGKDKGEAEGLLLGPRRQQFPLSDLSDMLAKEHVPWKRWFFEDMPEVVRDIGYQVANDRWEVDLPEWISDKLGFVPAADEHATRAHFTDRLYSENGWRRFYVWTRALRRLCSKYICTLILAEARQSRQHVMDMLADADLMDLAGLRIDIRAANRIDLVSLSWAEKSNLPHPEQFADAYITYVYEGERDEEGENRESESIADTIWEGIALVDVADPESTRFRRDRLTTSPPFLLWLYLRRMREYVVPNPLLTLHDFGIGTSVLNFDRSRTTLCFMLWYLSMMVERGRIPPHYSSVLETSYGGDNAMTVNVLADLHDGHKVVFYVNDRGQDVWPLLSSLPLAPRRLTETPDRIPQYWESTLFLGEKLSHAESEDQEAHEQCLMCQSFDTSVRERRNHAMVFCGNECHVKFRSFFPIGGQDDADLPGLFDVLYPILMRLDPGALVAVSHASPVARRIYVDERFRREYVKAHADAMWNLMGGSGEYMRDWLNVVMDDESTLSIHLTAWARLAILATVDNQEQGAQRLVQILAHPKFNAEHQFDRMLDMAIEAHNAPAVAVLVASSHRTRGLSYKGFIGVQWLWIAISSAKNGTGVLAELLKSPDPNIVSRDHVLNALNLMLERHRKELELDRVRGEMFNMLLLHPTVPTEDAYHYLSRRYPKMTIPEMDAYIAAARKRR